MRWLVGVVGLLVGCSDGSAETEGASSTSLAESTGSQSTATSEPTTAASTEPGTTGAQTGATESSTGGMETGTETGDETGEMVGGCGKPPDVSGSTPQKIMAAGVARDYILSLPADYDPNTQYPLVFAWHGRGGSSGLAQLYFKVEEAAQGQAIFVYPDGLPLAEMQGQTGWDLDPNNEDFALFDALLEEVQARLCVDPGRVFSTGHSFGGYMSNQIGCFRGDVVRAIGLVAGGGPYGGGCGGQVATWLAHGEDDMVVPFSEGESSRDHWTAANHCAATAEPVEPAPCSRFTGCDDGLPVVWCAHAEPALSGHGWPAWAGPAIWGFFAQL